MKPQNKYLQRTRGLQRSIFFVGCYQGSVGSVRMDVRVGRDPKVDLIEGPLLWR